MFTLPQQATDKESWRQNASALRREMRSGNPIYDSFVNDDGSRRATRGFLDAERKLLESQGWIYSPQTRAYTPHDDLPQTFARDASSAFDFLRSRYGYRRVDAYAYQVRYEAGKRYVLVSYDDRSHELTVWVGVDGDTALELADVLRASDAPSDVIAAVKLIQTSDEAAMARLLMRAATALATHGSQVLEARSARRAFAAAKRLRSQRAVEYTREGQMRGVIEKADAAWREKDFACVRDILAPHRALLTLTYAKRLEYAEKKL